MASIDFRLVAFSTSHVKRDKEGGQESRVRNQIRRTRRVLAPKTTRLPSRECVRPVRHLALQPASLNAQALSTLQIYIYIYIYIIYIYNIYIIYTIICVSIYIYVYMCVCYFYTLIRISFLIYACLHVRLYLYVSSSALKSTCIPACVSMFTTFASNHV